MQRWIGLLGAGLAAALPVSAPVMAQVYFHSDREQATTTQMAAALAAARKAHGGALDRHDANLEAGFKAGIAAVVNERLTSRDLVLAQYVQGYDAPLSAVVDARLSALTGEDPAHLALPPAPAAPAGTANPPGVAVVRQAILNLDRARTRLAFTRTIKPAAAQCDDDGLFKTAADSVADGDMGSRCQQVRDAREGLAKRLPCENTDMPGWHTLRIAGPMDLCWKKEAAEPPHPAVDQDPRIVVLQPGPGTALVRTLREAIAKQQEAQRITSVELKTLSEALADAQAARGAGPTQQIRAALCRFDWLVAGLQKAGLPADPATVAAKAPDCAGIAGFSDTDGPAMAAAKAADTQTGETLDKIQSVAKAAGSTDLGGAILASARATAEDIRGEQLGALLTAVSSKTSAEILADAKAAGPNAKRPSTGAILAVALVELATPINTLAQYYGHSLPDTNGVLVALAEARLRENLAQLEAGRLTTLLTLAEQAMAAKAGEAGLLTEAKVALGKAHTAATQALKKRLEDEAAVAYSMSVSRGEIPGEVLDYQRNHVEYRLWTARERAASEATFAMVSPAIDQLQAYGSGGVKPEALAGILNLIGLGAIAGTN